MPNIKDFVSPVEQGFLLDLLVNETFNGIPINNITLFVAAEAEADWYGDSDLAVNYSIVLRKVSSADDVIKMMATFYWDNAYTSTLQAKLIAAGFSTAAARNVATSEWGMQDEGRASYDAYTVADEVRAAML